PTPVATASRQASTTTAANAAAPAPATGGGGDGPVARLRLPAAGIDAPVIVGAVSASNVMIAPYSAWAVAWYGFSAEPGGNGNAVFSGHVDYINVGPAVFYNLGGVGAGDAVEVQMADGRSLAYRVEYNEVYAAGSGPWETIFAPWAGSDVITIYTCAGDWDGRDYTHRRVVRAVRAE
ncbi:MAG: class F sortase, partial [Dehalococcoidia bacterium]